MAYEQVQAQWVEHVQDGINNGHQRAENRDDAEATNQAPKRNYVLVLRYGGYIRNGEEFRDRLNTGAEMKPCRDALHDASCTHVLPEEALIFVKPEHFKATRRALDDLADFQLRKHHIVLCLELFLAAHVNRSLFY